MDERLVEDVLALVEQVPPGRVTTYGAIGDRLGRGPRIVGRVLSEYGGPVPWWRVVRADGSLPPSHQGVAVQEYLAEGTPMRAPGRIDIARAFWQPGTSSSGAERSSDG